MVGGFCFLFKKEATSYIDSLSFTPMQFLDKTLLDVNQQISEDKTMASNLIAKIIYGDPATFLSELPSNSTVHCSRMWSCRKRISVEHMEHVVQQKDGKETVPILWKFLQKVSMSSSLSVALAWDI